MIIFIFADNIIRYGKKKMKIFLKFTKGIRKSGY